MGKVMFAFVAVVTWSVVWVGPALAEHLALMPEARTSEPARSSRDVHIDLTFDADGFRLGARLFGEKGVSGAWLNGRVRPDGLTLDGRVQDGARAFNFVLDADTLRALAHSAVRGWLLRE